MSSTTPRPDRPQVVAGLAEWRKLTDHITELRRELSEEREVIGIIARERTELRGVVADLNADCAALRTRLAASLERERAQTEHRRRDYWGGVVLLYWLLTKRGK